MSHSKALITTIQSGAYDDRFARLYGEENVDTARARYIDAVHGFLDTFGEPQSALALFSAPGRTEIGGNHTDHNHGCVLAGSVNLDVIAIVAFNDGDTVRVKSKGYDMDTVSLSDLAVKDSEINRSASLIRGTAARFAQLSYHIGGFDAYTTSNVLKGSGLSSSAAFEVLIGCILSHGYNDGAVSAVEIAQIAQYTENVYFGKPSGLMDQMASSVGNIITIDFKDTDTPVIEQVNVDFAAAGHALCIVDVGGNHADLTHEYAAIPAEMKAVANTLGGKVLRDISPDTFYANIPTLRQKHGDRAVLRAIHFYEENDRVAAEVAALRAGDFNTFLQLIIASGNSSFEYLQNIYANVDVTDQGMSLALAIAQKALGGRGAYRVHGGGFGGTTQNFVPLDMLPTFKATIEAIFGEGSCHILRIRPYGGICVDKI